MFDYAYTTLLATDDYAYGVIGLLFSLREVQSKYPLHIIVTDNISTDILALLDEVEALYTIVPRIDFISNFQSYAMTLNKMQLFHLTQYKKVCFIDGDALVSKNIDSIFDMDPPGFIVFRPSFLSGILMLLDPKSHTFKKIKTRFRYAGTDEVIINHLYSVNKVTDLVEFFDSLIHMSNGGTGTRYKYWKIYNLNTINKLQKYIHTEMQSGFIRTFATFDDVAITQRQETNLLAP